MDEISARTTTPRPLWRNRDFGLLFGAQVVSLLGSGVTTVGLALFAYQITGGASATSVIGNALTLRILAFLLFSQPAGVITPPRRPNTNLISAHPPRFRPASRASACSRSFRSSPQSGRYMR